MALIHARSALEAQEFMLRALPECGDRLDIEFEEAYPDGDRLVSIFTAGCEDLGVSRRFEFSTEPLPERPEAHLFGGHAEWLARGLGDRLYGHGNEPSTLFDAGEWYVISARYVHAGLAEERRYAPDPPDVEAVGKITEWYARAWAALFEVLKFVPPGAEALPDSAFWTEAGRAARERVGEEFVRARLEPALAQLERGLRAFHDAYPTGT